MTHGEVKFSQAGFSSLDQGCQLEFRKDSPASRLGIFGPHTVKLRNVSSERERTGRGSNEGKGEEGEG